MPKSLQQYVTWLDHRKDLIWPQPPPPKPVAARPHLKPLKGVRAVVWNLYGTLLRITDGELLQLHHLELRMQVALEKTIAEFNMWNSMTRRPGAPWEYLLTKYRGFLEEMELSARVPAGEFPHVNSTILWLRLFGLLGHKDYQYDRDFYGTPEELSEKAAYFFHASLQGVEAAPEAVTALTALSRAGLVQGLLSDAQPFSLVQTLRAFRQQTTVPPLQELFDPGCLVLSHQFGVRKPSPTLFAVCVERFAERGIEPREILYVSNRLPGDLAVARQFGMKTALYAGDQSCLKATATEINHPDLRPRRLLTRLSQVTTLISDQSS